MAEKIEISDPRVRRLVDNVISDLEKFYPDKTVYSLNKLHKGLGNRVGELWPQVGYSSREDFLKAYGFELGGVRAGRPVTFDAEELLGELESRYAGIEKPSLLGELISENPDLKAKMKTFANKSMELYGITAAKVLKERGILGGGKGWGSVSDADVQSMLDALASKYKDASIKPAGLQELKADNPQHKNAITAFIRRGKELYGMTPKKKLVELGICPAAKGATIDAEPAEVEEAIDELGMILCDRAPSEKPGSIADLIKAYPDQGAYIKAGKAMGIVDNEPLKSLGILSPTKTLLRKQGVRRVPAEELVSEFANVVSDSYVEPDGNGSEYLPPFVVGYDVDNRVELRTALISVEGKSAEGMRLGDTFEAEVVIDTNVWGKQELSSIRVSSNPPGDFLPDIVAASLFDDAVNDSASKLSEFVGAKVVSVLKHEEDCVAQLEFTYLAELRSNTMIYVLRKTGVVKDADVAGDMGWRFRMRMAARESLREG